MDLRYVTYCQAGNAFYEDPATAAATTEPADVLAEPPSAGPGPSTATGWC